MDEPTYYNLSKCYNLISKQRDKINDSEVSYIIGLLESALTYNPQSPEQVAEIRSKNGNFQKKFKEIADKFTT